MTEGPAPSRRNDCELTPWIRIRAGKVGLVIGRLEEESDVSSMSCRMQSSVQRMPGVSPIEGQSLTDTHWWKRERHFVR